MFVKMIEMLKQNRKTLVFPEGHDLRILQAVVRLKHEGILEPLLLGDEAQVKQLAKDNGLDLEGIEIINPASYSRFDEMVETMAELRKGKMTADECRAALMKTNYFGTMLVKMGVADGLLGGATYSTADTVRPALQLIKTKPGNKIVSSCFILHREGPDGGERMAMADCAINLFPTEDELIEITTETAATAKLFDIDPKVALLSFSTMGSGKGESPEKMRNAVAKLKAMNLDFDVDGELQFDAAVSAEVGKLKAPDSKVAGCANTFIFPDINAGNIGYKIAQRLGGFEALGPILMGLNAPINDLSRGTNTEEVYKMAIITAATSV
ncbi:phosphate acetyltransferase [Ruminococcaceae bacterium OttesenSCG-928-D13]|nr:phosphate acetyltransferase [Ruminococcaceae bacterium OttesenSCG-928-D13]